MRRTFAALLTIAALASCVPPPRATAPPPAPQPVPTFQAAPAPLAADWNDWPRTPGAWRYGRDGYSTFARFGSVGVALSCGNDRKVRLQLDGRSSLAPLTVRTSSVTRSVTPGPIGDPPVGIAAALDPRDPLLDAIAFSRGRFTVEQPGAAPLVLPPWAEIGRVIEDCRA